MNWSPKTRRFFLQGAGKAALTLPLLPSLLPEKQAQAQVSNRQKTFIGIPLFSGLWGQQAGNQYSITPGGPSAYMPVFQNMQTFKPARGHVIASKPLETAKNDGGGQLSPIYDSKFNPYLSKMLMLQGLDFYFAPEFHKNAYFGNTGEAALLDATPPKQAGIDAVMTNSPNFFKNNPSAFGKTVCWTGNVAEFSYWTSHTYADPKNPKTCEINGINAEANPQRLWDSWFANFMPQPPMPATPPPPSLKQKVVDGVLSDYKSLRANPRLGREDRGMLDRHIDLLSETQNSLKAVSQVVATCDMGPTRPTVGNPDPNIGYAARKQVVAALNNVIVSMIACGLCHTFTSHFFSMLVDNPETWHAWSHSGEQLHFDQTKAVVQDVILDLVGKLNDNGLLDDSLVMVPNEHSQGNHSSLNMSLVLFGGAGGVFKTGQYIDYRNWASGTDLDPRSMRLGYNMPQALANILMAMGVPPSEFEPLNRASAATPFNTHYSPSNSGYGSTFFQYGSRFYDFPTRLAAFKGMNLSDWLPLIKV